MTDTPNSRSLMPRVSLPTAKQRGLLEKTSIATASSAFSRPSTPLTLANALLPGTSAEIAPLEMLDVLADRDLGLVSN